MDKMKQLDRLFGIDVGSTNIKMAAVVNGRFFQRIVPSGDFCSQETMIQKISEYYESFNANFRGIGIAFTGSTTDGLSVCRTPLHCLENLDVQNFRHLNDKIVLINDANAAALAGLFEYPDSKVLVSVTNGTGIGAGIAIDGKLFVGSHGFSGEIYGNPFLNANLDSTKVGKICSGSKVFKRLNVPAKTTSDEAIIHEASCYMGTVLVSLVHTLNPDVLYLTGGSFDFPHFFDFVKLYVQKNTYPFCLDNMTLTISRFGKLAGCIGAMCAIKQNFFAGENSKAGSI